MGLHNLYFNNPKPQVSSQTGKYCVGICGSARLAFCKAFKHEQYDSVRQGRVMPGGRARRGEATASRLLKRAGDGEDKEGEEGARTRQDRGTGGVVQT